ncbi:hypothetical protein SUGI_0700950 [Cryptomeria japonica]|nr:hypothetical protein SUGI_0700950 [Cryptomeria japonica]
MNSVNTASTFQLAPAPNFNAAVIVHQKLKVRNLARDERFEVVTPNGRKYGAYEINKDDVSEEPPVTTHAEGHSPGVGH